MEAQLQRPAHGYEEDPDQHAGLHSVIEGEGENNQHEKKSVLKKVKDKAKKIKDTIKKHGPGHGLEPEHEHEYRHDQISEEEEEDEDDQDEKMVNDPQVHGAPIYESAVITGTKLPMQTGVNLEKPTDTREDRLNPNVKDEVFTTNVGDEGISRPSPKVKTWPELGMPPIEPYEPEHKIRGHPYGTDKKEGNVGEPRARIGPLTGLEEDPHSPKNSPEQISVPNHQSKVTDPTGQGGKEAEVAPLIKRLDNLHVHDESKPRHEQKSYTGSHDQFAPQPTPTKDQFNPEMNPVGLSENPEQGPKSFDTAKPESMPRDTITGKISSATYAIADKAVSAKNMVASKLGYGGQDQEGQEDSSKKPPPLSESKSMPGGGDTTITGKMSSATSVIADKAVSAKNVVASKLGYGGGQSEEVVPDYSSKKPLTESAAGYGHIVYEKVAGAGTAILSKVQTGGGDTTAKFETGGGDMAPTGASDKGVTTMREYFVEKFRPGEEDKALSEAIADVFHKKKEEPVMGRVVESEEVAARLGTGMENKREGEDALAAGSESSGDGGGVVDRLKGAVSSWLGKSAGVETTAQESLGQSHVSGVGAGPTSQAGGGVGLTDEKVSRQ